MTICSAFKCMSGQSGSSTPVKSFLFIVKSDPGRNSQWAKWVQMRGRPNFSPTSTSVLCEKHFTEDQFVPDDQNLSVKGSANRRRKLILGALPTILGDIQEGKLVLPILLNCDTKCNSAISQEETPVNLPLQQDYFVFGLIS